MVVVQASKLKLPNPNLSSPTITSFLFEPHSLSLALMHSDSTFSLYPSISPISASSLPPPQTLISPPSSSSTFLLLQNPNPNPNTRVLFIVSGPYRGGAQILLRFHIHGVSIRLAGSVNYFAMYSVSSLKVWVFAVKLVDDDENCDVLKLMRCAVIECCNVVWSISVSLGFLILGEDNGVRVFNLRQLVKGRVRKSKILSSNPKPEGRNSGLPNGVMGENEVNGSKHGSSKCDGFEGTLEMTCNGNLCGKNDRNHVSVKQRSIKLKQDSHEEGVCFVAFKSKGLEPLESTRIIPAKAISIEALSPNKFLILDSDGGLRVLHLSSPLVGSNITSYICQLPHIMKVQKLAVLPDSASRTQSVWASDGYNSVHLMVACDTDNAVTEDDGNDSEEKLIHISVVLAIFAREKIQDLVPVSASAILILGQGSLYTYAIS